MAVIQVSFLALGAATAMIPWRRIPGWLGPAVLAVVALAIRVTPWHTARSAGHDLTGAIAFLLLAVPLAVLLDEIGFFGALAERVGTGRHLRAGLWALAAFVTIVFNLDAAVVLLTPLYVRIADKRGDDPVLLGAIPALLACLASSVLPVSNLTNLIAVQRVHVGVGNFLVHLGLPSVVAIAVGGVLYLRHAPDALVQGPTSVPLDQDSRGCAADASALRLGIPVVVFLLIGFTVGERIGVPAWAVAGTALLVLIVLRREVPWRHAPFGAALLAGGLGILAASASSHLPVRQLLAIHGIPGELATVGATALGSNAINNLPAVLLTLPGLDQHPQRIWAVLLGANIGPTLWVTGALSTLLWQATMRRLGHPVTALGYARLAARVGLPALAAATAVLVAQVALLRG